MSEMKNMLSDDYCTKCNKISIGGRCGEYFCLKFKTFCVRGMDVTECFEPEEPKEPKIQDTPLKWYQRLLRKLLK
jgi:hypothetical protein